MNFNLKETEVFQSWKSRVKIIYHRYGSISISDDLGYKKAYIFNFYVSKGWRSKGLGTALMKQAIEWCKENKIKTIKLLVGSDEKSLDWLKHYYSGFGFRDVGNNYMVKTIHYEITKQRIKVH